MAEKTDQIAHLKMERDKNVVKACELLVHDPSVLHSVKNGSKYGK